jgi:integrase
MTALTQEQCSELLESMEGHHWALPVQVALMTGLRRGELLGLKWSDIDWEQRRLSVKRALKQTGAGLTLEKPKTERSSRTISLPQAVLQVLGSHKAAQAEQKLALGKAYRDTDLVFARPDGSAVPPDTLSTGFADFIKRHPSLPKIRFHDPIMAERGGFEPPERLRAQRFSRPPHSTTLAPLRDALRGSGARPPAPQGSALIHEPRHAFNPAFA